MPSRARRKISRTVSAWMGSISRVFLVGGRAARRLDDPVADRRQRAVPEALAGVLLHGPQGVLGVLLGLVLVEQRHDLADHVAHRIVAELLGDRDETHAVLGEPADVELELELVAEEAAEAVDQDHVERRRLGRRRVDHALELGPPIVGGGRAGLDIVGDDLPAARRAVALRLAALVRDGEIVVGLPSRRDPQVEGRANRCGHGDLPRQSRVENSSSNRSPNQASNTSISASVTGTSFGPVVGHGPCRSESLRSSPASDGPARRA